MKKLLVLVLVGFSAFVVWLIEPVSYLPWSNTVQTHIQVANDFRCRDGQTIDLGEVENKLIDDLSLQKYLGMSAGIYKQDCERFIVAAGYSQKGKAEGFQTSTVGRVASITKPMTAIAIMQLYEQGKINLDDPIQTYLPEFPQNTQKQITVRHLLNHTSGIPHYSSKIDSLSFTHYESQNDAVDYIQSRGVISEPGERYTYSSFGYALLGAIIEKVSRLSLEEYLHLNVWQKAGMVNTSLEKEEQVKNKAGLYIKLGSFYLKSPRNDLSLIYAAGGVQSTTNDLLKFGEAILANKLVSRQTLEQMIDITNSISIAAGDDPYGLGWYVYHHKKDGRIIAHSGAQPGANSYLKVYLDKSIVVATLSNAFGTKASVHAITNDMARLALQVED